jgi:Zn-dependent protease
MADVYFYAAFIPIVAYSIIFHEVAHAVAALWSGDDTAKLANRITLNPVPHIDPFGTILFPGILIVISFLSDMKYPVVFGWAKPVPVNPYRYRNQVRGDLFVSLAGVITNFALAFIFVLLLHLTQWPTLMHPQGDMNFRLFIAAAGINIVLGVFNLIPIPPLDGSHVFKYLLPREARAGYERLGQYGIFLIFMFLMLGRDLFGVLLDGAIKIFLFLGGHGWWS